MYIYKPHCHKILLFITATKKDACKTNGRLEQPWDACDVAPFLLAQQSWRKVRKIHFPVLLQTHALYSFIEKRKLISNIPLNKTIYSKNNCPFLLGVFFIASIFILAVLFISYLDQIAYYPIIQYDCAKC